MINKLTMRPVCEKDVGEKEEQTHEHGNRFGNMILCVVALDCKLLVNIYHLSNKGVSL